MKYRIITISREFGSGGRTVAKALAERLNFQYYDQKLVDKIAEDSGFSKKFIADRGEDAVSPDYFAFAWNNYGGGLADQLYLAQRKVILDLAEKENCVIVGRCSDYILRDREDTLHIFIHADEEFRKKRIVELYGEGKESIENRLKKKDKRRIAYYRFYTGRRWGDAKNFDLCLNSGILGIDTCVDTIERIVKIK